MVEAGGDWENFVFKISFSLVGFFHLYFRATKELSGLFLSFLDFIILTDY